MGTLTSIKALAFKILEARVHFKPSPFFSKGEGRVRVPYSQSGLLSDKSDRIFALDSLPTPPPSLKEGGLKSLPFREGTTGIGKN
jgi:hypothetical protein